MVVLSHSSLVAAVLTVLTPGVWWKRYRAHSGALCPGMPFCAMLGMGAQLGAGPACCWALCCGSSGTTEPILFIIPGIVKEDPKLPEDKILPPPSPRPQNSIFDTDEEKSKVNLKAFLPATPLIFTAESTCRYMLCSFRAILMLLLNSRWRILWYFIRKHCLIKSELFLQK